MIISDCLDSISVNRAAELLEVSRSGFYKWFQRSISPDSDPNLEIRVSMSRTGNPYDNAFAESFIKTLKCEEVYLNEYATFNDALANIDRFIKEVYNLKRLHSSIGYKSPISFEEALSLNIEA